MQCRLILFEIGPITLSDHAPVMATIADIFPRGRDSVWCFPGYLTNCDTFGDLLKGWSWNIPALTQTKRKTLPSFGTEKKVISYRASYKKKIKTSYDEASSKLRIAYTDFKKHPSPQNREQWLTAKREFELWMDRIESIYRMKLETDLYRFGNKPGRLLANLAKGHRRSSHITTLRDDKEQEHMDPRQIRN